MALPFDIIDAVAPLPKTQPRHLRARPTNQVATDRVSRDTIFLSCLSTLVVIESPMDELALHGPEEFANHL